jgi:hypothetical protein
MDSAKPASGKQDDFAENAILYKKRRLPLALPGKLWQ